MHIDGPPMKLTTKMVTFQSIDRLIYQVRAAELEILRHFRLKDKVQTHIT